MEKIKNNENNMVADNDLEQVAAGSNFMERLHTLLFGHHEEENTDQTVNSDESGASGSW